MKNKKINFKQKFIKISDYWSPKVIAELNDYQFKLTKFKNEFIKHKHEDTDEAFIVIEGTIYIEIDNRVETINSGEMIVISKGMNHKPFVKEEAKVLIIEPRGVINTGTFISNLTANNDVWI
ncbi:MAG: cupin domain-containing protein [Flavobacteriaceae bacterium]|tara:strand:+ start:785 stop:1150 length:366 start_codon:yes stop_codon:yes gene_type:complete